MKLPPEKEVRETAILVVQDILNTCRGISRGILPKFKSKRSVDWKDPNNKTFLIDEFAHLTAETGLKTAFGNQIEVFGEEEQNKPPKTLNKIHKIVAFVDAIDGTDLLVRDFSNWCCAMVFMIPSEQRILCAVVGHGSGDIYYANDKGAYIRPRMAKGKKNRDKKLYRDPNVAVDLCHASICYYGQKPKNFLEVADHEGLSTKLKEFAQRMAGGIKSLGQAENKKETLGVRLYNLGGNPMMVRIASGAVDAIFSLSGAEIHDVLPGAYIAVQAGAVFTDLDGKPLDFTWAMQHPQKRFRYILSGSKQLGEELRRCLSFRQEKILASVQPQSSPQVGIVSELPPCDS
jgi:fructose-1,6-bisphosphatase/inositol monophosphatase family enzyme